MHFPKKERMIYLALILLAVCGLYFPAVQTMAEASAPCPVLVIDPGHGGADGGAVAPNGTLESTINLDVANRLNALAGFWGVPAVMTRESETLSYPAEAATLAAKKSADQNARIARIESTPGAVLLSIHQNYFPSSGPWGIQVFFRDTDQSRQLAETAQTNLTAQLSPDNRRLAAPIDDGIYLMKKVTCPAILVECGFLSNAAELEKLETEEYRMSLATVLLASYLQTQEELTQ